ncbi:hypothetical protein T484DRAFT_1942170, partial [Baffinella frigidus]
ARQGVCAVSLLGAVHAFGGSSILSRPLKTAEFFVPGSKKAWAPLPDMPFARVSAAAAVTLRI